MSIYTGVSGYWLYLAMLNDNLVFWGANGSMLNIAIITIDRYLKVVHHNCSKKYLRPWVLCSSIAFAWLVGILYNNVVVFFTAEVIDGVCYSYIFASHVSNLALITWYIIFFYFLVLAVFIFCYSRHPSSSTGDG